MTWQKEMRRNEQERHQLTKDLQRGNREIYEGYKILDGWADRIMKKFRIDMYADYPKRPKIGHF
jgi:hypothetical protein